MLPEPTKIQTGMTIEDYLNRPDTNQPMEFEDDKVMFLEMPTLDHQRIVKRLAKLLDAIAPHGEAVIAPYDVKLGKRVYQPDVFWAKQGGNCALSSRNGVGAPELIIEILSPTSKVRDRREKRKVYAEAGVEEYWLIDPDGGVVEIFTLADGHLAEAGLYSHEESFASAVLGGQTVDLKRVFLPDAPAASIIPPTDQPES